MKKAIISILLMLSFIFITACSDVNESSGESINSIENSTEESKTSSETESSISESNTAESSEENAESSEESKVDMPIGISEVNGIYYLNCEGGNEFTGDSNSVIGSEFEFSNGKEMINFLKKKEFTESDIRIMQQVFPKDKYGIKLGDMENLWVPTGIDFNYKEKYCSWFGDYGVSYANSNEFKAFRIIIEDVESYVSSKKSYDLYYTYEAIKSEDTTTKVELKEEIINGITYYTVNYSTKIAHAKTKYFSFEKNNILYNVYMDYKYVSVNENPNKISDKPYLMQVAVKDKERSYRITLKGDYINESIDYITSFGVEKISLK